MEDKVERLSPKARLTCADYQEVVLDAVAKIEGVDKIQPKNQIIPNICRNMEDLNKIVQFYKLTNHAYS